MNRTSSAPITHSGLAELLSLLVKHAAASSRESFAEARALQPH